MKLRFFAPLWGSEHLPFEAFLDKACESGFDGVEIHLPKQSFSFEEAERHCNLVKSKGLELILQHCETLESDFEQHKLALLDRVQHFAAFQPRFINSHTGRDFFSFEQNLILIDALAEIERSSGVSILNETHRSRFNFAAHVCAQFVNARPLIKQTADYSHFCCVAGTLLEDQHANLQTILPSIEHIHARVGFTESPQVSAPHAPEYAEALSIHMGWWLDILSLARKKQRESFTITCEFGPAPYMPTLPFTQQAISDQWECNKYMKKVIEEAYSARFS